MSHLFHSASRQWSAAKYKGQPSNKPLRFVPGRYVRASHRLYLDASADIVWALNHPDALIDWDLVVKVDVLCDAASDVLNCSICLENIFCAPRITRCGHVFCFPCIMRALDEKSKLCSEKPKCPVCGENVDVSELKPARFEVLKKPKVGESITMCLMTRKIDSLIAVLGQCSVRETFSFNDIGEEQRDSVIGTDFKRLVSPSLSSKCKHVSSIPEFLLSSNLSSYFYRVLSIDPNDPFLEEDLCSLESKRLECVTQEISSEVAWVDDCINNLLLTQIAKSGKTNQHAHGSTDTRTLMNPYECHLLYNFVYSDVNSVFEKLVNQNLESNKMRATEFSHSSNDTVYIFYQSLDGQMVFLEDLCMKCILKDQINRRQMQHSSVDNIGICAANNDDQSGAACDCRIIKQSDMNSSSSKPTTDICPPSSVAISDIHIVCSLPAVLDSSVIQNIEEEIVDAQFKTRYLNLNFLPRGTAVSFVEVDLSPFILPETLNEFQPMFQRRKRKRGIEQKRKLKIENEEDARIEARKSAQLVRLLEEHRNSNTRRDTVSGLLIETMTKDPLLFPSLEDGNPSSSSEAALTGSSALDEEHRPSETEIIYREESPVLKTRWASLVKQDTTARDSPPFEESTFLSSSQSPLGERNVQSKITLQDRFQAAGSSSIR